MVSKGTGAWPLTADSFAKGVSGCHAAGPRLCKRCGCVTARVLWCGLCVQEGARGPPNTCQVLSKAFGLADKSRLGNLVSFPIKKQRLGFQGEGTELECGPSWAVTAVLFRDSDWPGDCGPLGRPTCVGRAASGRASLGEEGLWSAC